MAQEEISSLLLKVGVDFAALEQFVATMPEVVAVAEAVGQQLDALPIGNPEIFKAKGAALSRALVAGFQAEALGLSFNGQTVAQIITDRVFGRLDQGAATKYVADVQRVLDTVRLQLPQVNQPLITAQSLGSLNTVQSLAAGAKRELEGLAAQLDKTLTQISVLAAVPVPKTVLAKTPEGGLAFTPSATKAIAAASAGGAFPQGLPTAFGQPVLKSNGTVNVTQTNAAVQSQIIAAIGDRISSLVGQKAALETQKANLGQVVQAVGLPSNPFALGAVANGFSVPQGIQDLNLPQASTTALSQAAQRAAEAVARSVGTVTDQVSALEAAQRRAVLSGSGLREAVENYQGGATKTPQQAFERLMRGESIAGYGAQSARLLLDGINASAPFVSGRDGFGSLTRGLKDTGYGDVPDYASRLLEEARTFGELRLAFAGFSSDRNISSGFAQNGKNPLVLELADGAKALDFNRVVPDPNGPFFDEREFLTSGRFAVDSITRGPLRPNEPIGSLNPEADIIRIRQLSTEYDALEQRVARIKAPLALPAGPREARRIEALLASADRPLPGALGSPENPRVISPPNPAGGFPGAPGLQAGTRAVNEQAAAIRQLGSDAANARPRIEGAAAAASRAGQRALPPGRGGALDFTFAEDFFGFRGGRRGPGFGAGGFAGAGAGGNFNGPSGFGFGQGAGGFPPPGPLGGGAGGAGGAGGRGGRGGGLPGLGGSGFSFGDGGLLDIRRILALSLAYSAVFSALNLVTTAFSTAVQGAIAFEQALTDLNIATGQTGRSNERLAFQLADAAASRGFAPAEGVAAGARAVGLFDATDAGEARQRAVIEASTKTAEQIAFISGQPLEQVQTQIAGITRSFDIDALDQQRVADVASFLGRRTGRPGGEILQSLGQIGSLGESAGFGLEEVGAIIARLTSTTGQTPQAVSGFLSQVLSKADDPNVTRTLRGLGIDTSGTLADQIDQLARANLSRGQRNQVIQAFGRGRSGQALGIILDQKDEINALAEGARTGSQGLAEEDFQQAVNTVGGQLRVLGTELLDLATGLASSGILDFLVLLLSAVGGVVDVLDFLVDGFNLIPREVRSVVGSLAVLAGSIALLGRFGPLSGALTGFAGRSVGNGFLAGTVGAATTGVRSTVGGFASGLGAAAASAGGLGSAAGLRAAASAGFGSLLGPLVTRAPAAFGISTLTGATASATPGLLNAAVIPGGITGLTALGVAASGTAAALVALGVASEFVQASQTQRAIDAAGVAANAAVTDAEFASADRAASDALARAKEREDFKLLSSDSFTLGLANIFDDLRGAITGGGSKQQIADAEAIKKRIDEDRKRAEALSKADTASVFGDFEGPDQINQALEELTSKGIPAAERIRLLNQAFDGLILKADASRDAVGVIFQGQGEVFTRAIAGSSVTGAENFLRAQQAQAQALDPLRGDDGTGRSLLRGARGFLVSNPVTALPGLQVLAGAAGGFAGSSGFLGRLRGGLRGGFDVGVNAVAEFNPFQESDSERAERQDEAAKRLRSALGDEDVQSKLRDGVTAVLQNRGKDPALGPVTLTKADRDAISRTQLAILKESLGEDFDNLTKEQKEAFAASVTDNVGQALGDFNGVEITAANAAAFLTATRANAAQAGADLALTSGSDLQGAQENERILEGARARIQTQIAAANAKIAGLGEGEDRDLAVADRDALQNLLKQLGLDILAAERSTTQQLLARADAVAELQKSLLAEGDTLGANRIEADAIRQKLANSNLTENERTQLEAQQNLVARRDQQERLAIDAAAAQNRLPAGDRAGRLRAQIDALQEQRATVAQRSQLYEQLTSQIGTAEDELVQLGLTLRGAQRQGRRGFNVNSLADTQLARDNAIDAYNVALQRGDAVGAQQAANDFFRAEQERLVANPLRKRQAERLAASSGSSFQDARATFQNESDLLQTLTAGTPEFIEQQRKVRDAQRQVEDEQARLFAAYRNDQVTPGNSLEAAQEAAVIARAQASRLLARFGRGSAEFQEANQAADVAEFAARQERVATENARRRSRINPGNELANAQADVQDAIANLALTETDSREFFEAQRRLAEARRNLATLQRDIADRTRRLGSDLTDPVEQARLDVKAAVERLRAAEAEGGDTTQEQLDVRNAQNNAEAAAFQQRFNDARTADDLGRISHAQYLEYLNNERDRLLAITDRTRQQQEQLDQVDQAIKSANEQLSGQFNLGDIKVPTPFEVRRSIAASVGGGQLAGVTSTVSTVNTTNEVNINGADLVEVKNLLVQLLGAPATQRSTPTPGRKI